MFGYGNKPLSSLKRYVLDIKKDDALKRASPEATLAARLAHVDAMAFYTIGNRDLTDKRIFNDAELAHFADTRVASSYNVTPPSLGVHMSATEITDVVEFLCAHSTRWLRRRGLAIEENRGCDVSSSPIVQLVLAQALLSGDPVDNGDGETAAMEMLLPRPLVVATSATQKYTE